MDIARNGEVEATSYFYSIGDHESVLDLTFNHDGRRYEMGTAYAHIAIGVDDLAGTVASCRNRTSSPSGRRTR
jgi:lactoylglutathione lyase